MAGMFGLFTIGIPVVIASCPMPKSPKAVCSQCIPYEGQDGERLTRSIDASCCATVILATGNTTEFERSNTFGPIDVAVKGPVTVPTTAFDHSPGNAVPASPYLPLLDNIPIRCSALLI